MTRASVTTSNGAINDAKSAGRAWDKVLIWEAKERPVRDSGSFEALFDDAAKR